MVVLSLRRPPLSPLSLTLMRTFVVIYYLLAALTLAAATCLPWLVPLSYRALGFAPELADEGTYAAFQAHLATHALRYGLLTHVLTLALALGALSVLALILQLRRRIRLRWFVLLAATVGSAGLAVVAIGGLRVGICC